MRGGLFIEEGSLPSWSECILDSHTEYETTKTNKMEKRKLEMTLETARKLYEFDKQEYSWILETFPELKGGKSWRGLGLVSGYYTDNSSYIRQCSDYLTNSDNKNVYATEAQAESAIAYAQITQLMKDLNGNWRPQYMEKHYIVSRLIDGDISIKLCGAFVKISAPSFFS